MSRYISATVILVLAGFLFGIIIDFNSADRPAPDALSASRFSPGHHTSRCGRRPASRGVGRGAARAVTSAAPRGRILFRSSFDSGFAGWTVQALPGRISLVSGSAYEGASDARFEVRPGDVEPDTGSNRAELSGPTFDEGRGHLRQGRDPGPHRQHLPRPWQIIQQLHETDWGGSPGIAVFLGADRSLTLGAGDGSPDYWCGPKLAAERWYDLVYHVKLSSDPAVGFVEVWLNGVPQQLSNGQTKAFGPTIQTAHTYLKVGIYRGKASTGISVVEHDNVVVGTSLAAVMGA